MCLMWLPVSFSCCCVGSLLCPNLVMMFHPVTRGRVDTRASSNPICLLHLTDIRAARARGGVITALSLPDFAIKALLA
jgi:hypothetical protein